ncbi:MAG TPA: SH3 domain-containing protein [archaeon]|nr:SH3 domain-containing protein [archaeon]
MLVQGKNFFVFSAFAFLLVLPVSLLSRPARQLTVVQEKAPMFKEPSISSPIIKYLEKGSKLNLLAAEDSFYLVSYGGYEGWVIPYSVFKEDSGMAEEGVHAVETPTEEAPAVGDLDLASGRYLVVTNRYANVREGPGLNYKLVGRAYRGDKLEKFIKRGKWYRVRLPNSKIGFIREDLVADPTAGDKAQSEIQPSEEVQEYDQKTEALSLEEKVERLEREVASLRKLLNDHIEEHKALIAQLMRYKKSFDISDFSTESPVTKLLESTIQSQTGKPLIIGNKATEVYHLPGSSYYDKIPEEFRLYFYTEEEARKAGYTKSLK